MEYTEPQITNNIVEVKCPYCDKDFYQGGETNNWDFLDEEFHIIKCSNCGKEYEISIYRPIEYVVSKIMEK